MPPVAKASIDDQNTFLRRRLLASGIHEEVSLGTANLTIGGTTRIKLNNIGITTRLTCLFTFSYTPGATNTLAPFGFLNAITKLNLQDFDSQSRINANAAHVFMANSLQQLRKDGLISPQFSGIGGAEGFGTAGITVPNAGLTAAAQTAQILLEIPIAVDYDHGDLRGAMALQSNVGEAYLSIDIASLLQNASVADDTKAFNNTGSTTFTSATCEILQSFILPQVDQVTLQAVQTGHISPNFVQGGMPLPPLDLSTVNEIVTSPTSAGLAAGQETLINLPNTRNITTLLYRWFNNSVQGGAATTNDITQHRILVNGASAIQTRDLAMQYLRQRQQTNFDFGKGAYFFDFIGVKGSGRQPIQTAQIGNVQLGVTPASVAGNTYVDYAVQSLYSKGAALGGLIP